MTSAMLAGALSDRQPAAMSHGMMARVVLLLLIVCSCGPSPAVVMNAGRLARDAGDTTDSGFVVDAGGDVVDGGSPDGGLSSVDAGPSSVDAGSFDGGRDPLVLMRPFDVTVPAGARADQPLPLVVLLHGYTMTAQSQDMYFGMSRLAQQRRFFVALPNGLRDASNQQYWNATDACCALGKTNDDVAYLAAVIRDVQARYAVDPKRIFIVGYSNGGFMAHRLSCELADVVAGFVALAGNTWADPSRCNPSQGIAALQLHGTVDAIIPYDGGTTFGPAFPSARDSVRTWAIKNACTGNALTPIAGDLDLETALAGTETERAGFTGCPGNAAAELWTIRGATHLPALTASFSDRVYSWLLAHPKP